MISSEKLQNYLREPTIEDLEEFKKIMYTRHGRRVFETKVWLKIQNKEDRRTIHKGEKYVITWLKIQNKEDRRRRNIISDFFVLDLTNVDDPEKIIRDLQNGNILQDTNKRIYRIYAVKDFEPNDGNDGTEVTVVRPKEIYTDKDFEPGLPYNYVQISPGGFQYYIWTEILNR
jgi:hypothetical protein